MTIPELALRSGAAWEIPTVELIAELTKACKKKLIKAGLGTKAAKSAERLESVGDELKRKAATVFRAFAAGYLYPSTDRPECAFSAR